MKWWWSSQNLKSIDGLPALERAAETPSHFSYHVPEGELAGFKKRGELKSINEVRDSLPSHGTYIEKMISNEHLRLAYGIILGFGLSFVMSDLYTAIQKFSMP